MDVEAANILLCLRYGIGDLIMELPVLDQLREALPRAAITGLGAEPAVEILDGDPRLDAVLSLQQWSIRHLNDPADEEVRRRVGEWLASRRFDLVLDPSHTADVVRQIIYQQDLALRDADSACLEAGLAQGLDGLGAVKHATFLGWRLNVPAPARPRVRLQDHEMEWARVFLQARDLPQDLVAISPGASVELKRWPIGHFAQVCHFLVREMGVGVLVFGGTGEDGLLAEFRGRTQDLPRVEIVRNQHLRRVAALLAQCGLLLGNDSGLMHLAAAVGTPVVALFGPTDPNLYLPGWARARAVTSHVTCPYRPRRAFGHPRCVLAGACLMGTPCLQTIEPAQVCQVVPEEYARPTARPSPKPWALRLPPAL